MSQILQFFPIKIYKTKYSKIEELKTVIIPKLEQLWDQAAMVSNEITDCVIGRTDCGYVIDSNLEVWPETQDLVSFLNSEVQIYWNELDYSKSLTPYVHNLWANRSHDRSYIHSHIHSPMPLAGCVYLTANKEMGTFILEDPNEMLLRSQPVDNPDIIAEVEIEVEPGDILIFPGYIRHRTKANKTNLPRMTLPFVIGCEGKFSTGHWVSRSA